jgi:hypothetical protein
MIGKVIKRVKYLINSSIKDAQKEQNTQIEQVLIANQYKLMKKLFSPGDMPAFNDVGFTIHSEFEEDGILLYIFSLIGTTNKRVVEICAGEGVQCMATNLILNHGWEGLLFDGDKGSVERGKVFFATKQATFAYPPKFINSWITKDNVNQIISENGFSGNIDLLSMDIDGNDYYIMEAIDVIKPRVIVCETHNIIPSNLSLTIPYKEDFYYRDGNQNIEFRSVSLLAMKKLLVNKGYRLVGGHKYGFNVFFMLNGIGEDYFPEVSVESVHENPFTKYRMEADWGKLMHLPWVQV